MNDNRPTLREAPFESNTTSRSFDGYPSKLLRVLLAVVLVVTLVPLVSSGSTRSAQAADAPSFDEVTITPGTEVVFNSRSTTAITGDKVMAEASTDAMKASEIDARVGTYITDEYGSDTLGSALLSNAFVPSIADVASNQWRRVLPASDKAYWLADTSSMFGMATRAYRNADNTEPFQEPVLSGLTSSGSELYQEPAYLESYDFTSDATLSDYTVAQTYGQWAWDASVSQAYKHYAVRGIGATYAIAYNNPFKYSLPDGKRYARAYLDLPQAIIAGVVSIEGGNAKITSVEAGETYPAGTLFLSTAMAGGFASGDSTRKFQRRDLYTAGEYYITYMEFEKDVTIEELGDYTATRAADYLIYSRVVEAGTEVTGDTVTAGSYGLRPAMDFATDDIAFMRDETSHAVLTVDSVLGDAPTSVTAAKSSYKPVVYDDTLAAPTSSGAITTDKGAATVDGSTIKVIPGSKKLFIPLNTPAAARYVSVLASTASGLTRYGTVARASNGSATLEVDLSDLMSTGFAGSTIQMSLFSEYANDAGVADGISRTSTPFSVVVDYGVEHTVTYGAAGGLGATLPVQAPVRVGDVLSVGDGEGLINPDGNPFSLWEAIWSDGTQDIYRPGQIVTMRDADLELNALYSGVSLSKNTTTKGATGFMVTYEAEPGGSVDPAGSYEIPFNDTGEITGSVATPEEGYAFDGWYKVNESNKRISTNPYLSPEVAQNNLNRDSLGTKNFDTTFTARFKQIGGQMREMDWFGSSTMTMMQVRSITFTDTAPDSYSEKWNAARSGVVDAYVVENGVIDYGEEAGNIGYDLYLVSPRGSIRPGDWAEGLFDAFCSVTEINFNDHFDTSQVVNMRRMFEGCSYLENLDLSGFNTSQVTDMFQMFSSCYALSSLDLSSFDTSQVTNMSEMFSDMLDVRDIDVSSFDTSQVRDMNSMFGGCSNLPSVDLSSFDTSWVSNMNSMFAGCSALTSLDVSGFKTFRMTDMGGMFQSCSSLTSLDLSSLDTSQVTKMNSLFANCANLVSVDLSSFDTNRTTSMSFMFQHCSKLASLDLSSFRTQNVELMSYMFDSCSSLTVLDLSMFNTGKSYSPQSMNNMFAGMDTTCLVYCRTVPDQTRMENSSGRSIPRDNFILGAPPATLSQENTDDVGASMVASEKEEGESSSSSSDSVEGTDSSEEPTPSMSLVSSALSPAEAHADEASPAVSVRTSEDVIDMGEISTSTTLEYTLHVANVGSEGDTIDVLTFTDVMPKYVHAALFASIEKPLRLHNSQGGAMLGDYDYDIETRTLTFQVLNLLPGNEVDISFYAGVSEDAASLGVDLVEYVNQASVMVGDSVKVSNAVRHYSGARSENSYDVSYSYTGTISGSAPTLPSSIAYSPGVEVTLAPAPAVPGYTFDGWQVSGAAVTDGSFIMPDSAVSITGNWTKDPDPVKHTLSYTWAGRDEGISGTASDADKPSALPVLPASDVSEDSVVSLPAYPSVGATTATAAADDPYKALYEGYEFLGWTTATGHAITDDEREAGKFTLDQDTTLVGCWERRSFEATYAFDASAPTTAVPPTSLSAKRGESFTLSDPTEVEGYRFLGWSLSSDLAQVGDGYVMPSRNVVATGSWEKLYSVSVTNGTSDKPWYAPGDTVTITPNTYDGVDFFQWNFVGDVPGDISEDASGTQTFTMPTGNMSVSASYAATVTYKVQQGAWSNGSVCDIKESVELSGAPGAWSGTLNASGVPAGMVPAAGYDLTTGAWDNVPNTASGAITSSVDYTYSFGLAESVDVVYQSVDGAKGSVTYNEDGAVPQEKTSETISTPATGSPKGATAEPKAGYTFVGWSTAWGLGSEQYTISEDVSFVPAKDAKTNLYKATTYTANFAVTGDATYTVKYDMNDGDSDFKADPTTIADKTDARWDSADLVAVTPTRQGYTFDGWVVKGDTSKAVTESTLYSSLVSGPEVNEVTLQATWSEGAEVALSYVSSDTAMGTVDPASEDVSPITGNATGATATAKTGYHFVNWTNTADSTKTTDATLSADQVNASAKTNNVYTATTFTANFAPNTDTKYRVERYQQNTTGATYTPITSDDQNLTGTTDTAPNVSDKTYTGFTKAKTTYASTGIAESETARTIAPDGSLVVKVYYDRATNDVTFDENGHGSAPAKQSAIRYGAQVADPGNLSEVGWTFGGWYTDAACTDAAKWNFTTDTTPNNPLTLYAKWTQNTYTVSYDMNDTDSASKASPASIADRTDVHWNSAGLVSTTPTRAGYTFAGWVVKGETSKKVGSTTAYSTLVADDQVSGVTLQATWTENANVTLSYVSSDTSKGTVTPARDSVAPATGNATGATATAKTGYHFVNWTNSSNSTKTTDATLSADQVNAAAKTNNVYTATTFTANFARDDASPDNEQIIAHDFSLSVAEAQSILQGGVFESDSLIRVAYAADPLDAGRVELIRLADAQARSTIDGQSVDITAVVHAIKAEKGVYAVTFETQAGTSATVQATVTDNSAESAVNAERIFADDIELTYEEAGVLLAKSQNDIATELADRMKAHAYSTADGSEVAVVKADWKVVQAPGVYEVTFFTDKGTQVVARVTVGDKVIDDGSNGVSDGQSSGQGFVGSATTSKTADSNGVFAGLLTLLAAASITTAVFVRRRRGGRE